MPTQDVLSQWENFYIIVGSSAGALTGLQFVVMALVAGLPTRADPGTIDTFGTPTVVHFCAVLLVSSLLSWPSSRKPPPPSEFLEQRGSSTA
jgi:hypothetical protein